MRFDTAIWDQLVHQAAAALLNTYTNQLDQIPVMKAAKHLNFSQEFTTTLLIVSLQNFDSNFGAIFKNTAINTPKASFPKYFRSTEMIGCSLYVACAESLGRSCISCNARSK